jgi:hypothetical protein
MCGSAAPLTDKIRTLRALQNRKRFCSSSGFAVLSAEAESSLLLSNIQDLSP